MSPITLNKKQKQILDYIKQHIQSKGSAPTLKEIAIAIGVSSLATVHEHLTSLEAKKLIGRKTGKSRAIELVGEDVTISKEGIDIPVLGFIAAGAPGRMWSSMAMRLSSHPPISNTSRSFNNWDRRLLSKTSRFSIRSSKRSSLKRTGPFGNRMCSRFARNIHP